MNRFIIFIFIFAAISANGQLFEGGIDFGLIASQVDGDDHGGYHQAGITALFYSTLNLSEKTSISSGVGYAKKGAHSGLKQEFFSTRLYYAEIPVFLNIKPFTRINFSAGLVYSYLFNGNLLTNYSTTNQEDLNLRNYELSYTFSLNYILSERFTIKFTDNYSLMPITKPFSGTRYSNNLLLYYFFAANSSTVPAWWNNNVRISLQYKIFWSGKNE